MSQENSSPDIGSEAFANEVFEGMRSVHGDPNWDQEEAHVQNVTATVLTALLKSIYFGEQAMETDNTEAKMAAVQAGADYVQEVMKFASGPQNALKLITSLGMANIKAMMRDRGFDDVTKYVHWVQSPEGKERIRAEAHSKGMLMDWPVQGE
jgi:hypothetical protein